MHNFVLANKVILNVIACRAEHKSTLRVFCPRTATLFVTLDEWQLNTAMFLFKYGNSNAHDVTAQLYHNLKPPDIIY